MNAGLGKVTAYIPQNGNDILQSSLPEVMTLQSEGADFITDFNQELKDVSLYIGYGIGEDKDTCTAFAKAIKQQLSPSVLDADGILILAKHLEFLKELPKDSILTPHDGESKLLIGGRSNSYNRLEKAQEFSKNNSGIFVLKGAHTVTIARCDLYINHKCDPGRLLP
jgi:NAD(P)H-hydrate repair Nnr-like enzyme with NAD(P)H-hydrate dehydratase domain